MSDDAWPDPNIAKAKRARRRRVARWLLEVAGLVAVLWLSVWLGLLDRRGVILVVGGLLAMVTARLFVAREAADRPGPFSQIMQTQRHAALPSDRLVELERSLDLATVSAGDAYHVLRPLVIDIAGSWLQSAHGIGLGDRRAASLLPPDLWALASPDARRTDDPHQPGPSLADLEILISHLEALR